MCQPSQIKPFRLNSVSRLTVGDAYVSTQSDKTIQTERSVTNVRWATPICQPIQRNLKIQTLHIGTVKLHAYMTDIHEHCAKYVR